VSDESTLGGYVAVHKRPAAFTGVDGQPYTVDVGTDETGDPDAPVGAYLLFIRWAGETPAIAGHLESAFLARGATEAEARAAIDRMTLLDVKTTLDGLLAPADERAVVLSGTGGVWTVRTAGGAIREVSLRGRLKQAGVAPLKLAVGDDVRIERETRGDAWAIAEILPRRSVLARRAPGNAYGERVVAANVDQVIIVFAAASPEPHPRMLDRFLVIAEANELRAHIVINKIDLVEFDAARERFRDYVAAGYPLHFTSTVTRAGLDDLAAALRARTSALSGPSGVGKSSLLNALYPGLNLRVGAISESVNKGRHTTVGAVFHPLPGGGFVADTPGLREVGVWGLVPDQLDRCFPEFLPFIGECRFGDCHHTVEPGCAVRGAVDAGVVSAARYDSYRRLREELA
jgi:ribosome biogenesis GTPase / thiamine phosphate phosphatase